MLSTKKFQVRNETHRLFVEKKEKLLVELKAAIQFSTVCIAVDMWHDSIRHLNYLGAMVHFVTQDKEKNYKLCAKAMALKVMDAEDDKNAENIHRDVIDIVSQYDLFDDIDEIAFLSDRGPDIKAALDGYRRNFCLAHLMNNLVQHASSPTIDTLTKNVSRIVRYMKFNGLNSKLSTCLMSYVSMRWNTRHDMFNSVLKHFLEIGPLIKKQSIKHLCNNIDLEELKQVSDFLGVYKNLTHEVEGDQTPNCVNVLPCITTITKHHITKRSDHKTVVDMKKAAEVYFENNVMNFLPNNYEAWAFFNPQWKRLDFLPMENRENIIKRVTKSIPLSINTK